VTLHVSPTADEAARRAALHIAEHARRAIAGRGRFVIALAGGSTPERVYRRLTVVADIEWSKWEVFFGDERCVPPDDPASNHRMAWETLLDHVPVRLEAVHRIAGEIEPVEAAALYAEDIIVIVGLPPCFDMVLLGVGEDGHTASVFPDTPHHETVDQIVVATRAPVEPRDRVSLSLSTIRDARNVTMLVFGKAKAAISRTLLTTQAGLTLPAARAEPRRGSFDWFTDEDAYPG